MKAFFILTLALWTVPAVHHLVRLVRRRHPLSAATALYPLGWAFFAGREAHLIGLEVAHVGSALALVLGVLCASLCIATWLAEWSRR